MAMLMNAANLHQVFAPTCPTVLCIVAIPHLPER